MKRYSQDDIENFKTSVLTAMDSVRPVKCGILPLPTLGVHRPPKEKLKREVKLPEWMYRQLECNQAPGRYGGQALGHAAMLELAKRETLGTFISDPWHDISMALATLGIFGKFEIFGCQGRFRLRFRAQKCQSQWKKLRGKEDLLEKGDGTC